MRKSIQWVILSLLIIIVGGTTGFCADEMKIGVVEFQRLFENSEAGKVIKAEITEKGKKMEAELKEKGVKLIDQKPRIGAGGAKIAFLHPKATAGVLVELCQRD